MNGRTLIAAGAASAVLATCGAAIANSGSQDNPLGVKLNAGAYAYSYGDYIHTFTITTGAHAVYNVKAINPGFPGGGDWQLVASSVPAHSTVTETPNFGAWYIDPHTVLDLPVTYTSQPSGGKTYSTYVFGSYAIQP